MKISKNKIILIAVIGIFAAFLGQFIFRLSFPDINIVRKDEKIKLYPYYPLAQKFTATRNNLAKIKFTMGSYELESKEKIKLRLADETCQKIIREDALNVSDFNSDNYYIFDFSKIKDSQDKIYCFLLTFEPKDENTTKKPRVAVSQSSDFPFVSLAELNSERAYPGKSLAMKPAYKNENLWQDLEELNQRISQYKPFFLKKYYLASIVIAFLALSFTLVIFLIIL